MSSVEKFQICLHSKKRLLLRSNRSTDGVRNTNSIRFDYMTKQEQLEVLRLKTDKLEKSRGEMFFLRSKNVRLKLRSRTLKDKLTEHSKRGDMRAICNKLVKAQSKGILSEKCVLLDTIESVANNFHVAGPSGKRYKSSCRKFYESLLIMGGPKLANFVAINLEGPNLNSIYRWRQLHTFEM